jgi:hypothetical protein
VLMVAPTIKGRSPWCDQAAASILSLPPDLARRFWVLKDEVASLQELPLTPDGGLLTMSRKLPSSACRTSGSCGACTESMGRKLRALPKRTTA